MIHISRCDRRRLDSIYSIIKTSFLLSNAYLKRLGFCNDAEPNKGNGPRMQETGELLKC